MTDPSARPVAIVTGANQGIGAAVARQLAAHGVAVLATYFRMPPLEDPANPDQYDHDRASDATQVMAEIAADGGVAFALEADLTDASVIPAMFDAAERELGPVSILVNNASSWLADTFLGSERDHMNRKLASIDATSFDHQFAVDARATALLIAELARRCEGPGRIVTMTSSGRDGWPGEVSYAAAKRAGESYTLSASLEFRDRGITANCVCPPPTDTGWVSDAVRDSIIAGGMRVAQPDEVAGVVAWLCSPAAAGVTGNVVQMH
ncbi:MAG: short-chain dehydrogenase [Actinobacteria bacterium HGW-Actinobacteria-4]|nr:MAG: short-chain dehydrogenase [Actinobacteria bacterium HGW-Actinobacteria-4]